MVLQVLLVDDDPVIHRLVTASLKTSFQVLSCHSIAQCKQFLERDESPALILIDRMLPDGDGLNLITSIRDNPRFSQTPIIFLSAKDSETDKVAGLYAGAEDYITKPFGPIELKARIEARLKNLKRVLIGHGLELDLGALRVWSTTGSQKVELNLTSIEFRLLSVLLQNDGDILSRDRLLDAGWGVNTHLSDRVVDTHMSHLRKKLNGLPLKVEAVRGEGYRLVTVQDARRSA